MNLDDRKPLVVKCDWMEERSIAAARLRQENVSAIQDLRDYMLFSSVTINNLCPPLKRLWLRLSGQTATLDHDVAFTHNQFMIAKHAVEGFDSAYVRELERVENARRLQALADQRNARRLGRLALRAATSDDD